MQFYGTSDALETVGGNKKRQTSHLARKKERTNERAGGRMKANERPNGKSRIMGYNKIEKSLIFWSSKRIEC